MAESSPNREGAFDIDRVIHEPARLMVLSHLYVIESADFLFLMQQTGLTQGNLSSHLSKLEAARYVEVLKQFVEKKPRTLLRLTAEGREAFNVYLARMRSILDAVSSREQAKSAPVMRPAPAKT